MPLLMALSRPPPSPWTPPAPDLSIAPATARMKASRSGHNLQCHGFSHGSLLPEAPPLHSSALTAPQAADARVLLPNLVAKVFGPANFEASKLDVLFLGVRKDEHPHDLPRIYTLTHCDLTAMLTLTVSKSINKTQLQGWYKRLQRDDVVAMWRRCQGSMSLHVHCHISGGHWFRDAFAKLRFHIFKRELPVVLKAFQHGDRALMKKHPELEEAPVWVYFHSNVKEFDKVEYWGTLMQGGQFVGEGIMQDFGEEPAMCRRPCDCCFPRCDIAADCNPMCFLL